MKKFTFFIIIIFSFFNMACGNELGDDFQMVVKVLNIGEKIEVEVFESENDASGIYWVITSDETEYFNQNGEKLSKENIEIGDTIEIFYGGQVMMSYPPQIVAKKIVLK